MDIKKSLSSKFHNACFNFTLFIFLTVLSAFQTSHANMSEEITLLPTITAPALLQINKEATAQFAIKNLSQKTQTLALLPQKGVKQDTSGLLACHHPFTLRPGEKCLLNLKIKGQKAGQKIGYGPLICPSTSKGKIKQDASFCVRPTQRDRLNTSIVASKKAVIEVKPQVLNLHAASVSPKVLTVMNHSQSITAKNIKAHLPAKWSDVKQNAKDCVKLLPNTSCKLYFNAKRAHALETVSIYGDNTSKFPLKFKVQAHDVKKLGPAAPMQN